MTVTFSTTSSSADAHTILPTQAAPEATSRVYEGTTRCSGGSNPVQDHVGLSRAQSLDSVPANGDIMATARNSIGSPTGQRLPTTTIELEPGNPGSRTSLAAALIMGMVTKTSEGDYVAVGQQSRAPTQSPTEALAQAMQPEQPTEVGPELFAADQEAHYSSTIEAIPQQLYDRALISAADAIAETGNFEDFTASLASASGLPDHQIEAAKAAGMAMFQAQADRAVASLGADPQEFYQWAREQHKEALGRAIREQVTGRNLGGYRELAKTYLDQVAPSLDVLESHGYEVKQAPANGKGGNDMVRINGTWMEVKTAARIGLI